MFVGHYAVAFALKGKERNASLGLLFLATQFVDILYFPFVLLGIEKMEFVPGFTQMNDFKMEFPFTHGLLGSVFWSVVFGGLYYVVWGKNKEYGKSIALVLGLGVLSHWFADLLVHTPDLPLVYGEPKFGLGLWNHKTLTFALEALLLVLGAASYLKHTQPKSAIGKIAPTGLVAFLILINYVNYYVLPASEDVVGLTISALLAYVLLAILAFWVDGKRN